jgi:hypothetical protein
MQMKTTLILAALLGGAALFGISAPAMADHGHHGGGYGFSVGFGYYPSYVYVAPPVYYAPSPVYYVETPYSSYYDSYGNLVSVYVSFDSYHRPHYSYRYHRR